MSANMGMETEDKGTEEENSEVEKKEKGGERNRRGRETETEPELQDGPGHHYCGYFFYMK